MTEQREKALQVANRIRNKIIGNSKVSDSELADIICESYSSEGYHNVVETRLVSIGENKARIKLIVIKGPETREDIYLDIELSVDVLKQWAKEFYELSVPIDVNEQSQYKNDQSQNP